MDPHQAHPTTPLAMFTSLWRNRQLIWQLTRRDVIGRYRGSLMGLAWSFLTPLLMLVVYTFVFSVVFKARWNINVEESKTDFAIILFTGMIVFNLFAEIVNRAPGLIVSNTNYVKKVVFPLEIFSWVTLGSVLFHSLVSLAVLLLVQIVLNHSLPWTVIFFPFVLLPLIFASLGVAWFLAALGVFVRDIGQLTGVFTTVLMFLSAVFYPLTSLPERYQGLLMLNPLVLIITESRKVLIFGSLPDWFSLGIALLAGFGLAAAASGGFKKRAKDLQMSSNEYAIKVEGLSKLYQIYNRPEDRLKQSIVPRLQALVGKSPKTYFHEFWALRDVSFEIKRGETVGVIGRNGSGKSTLLQLICGTLTPTVGKVMTNGRIAALLELGSGFNPEFTGRENVYLNGAILGLDRHEIDARFDDIAAFADIGEFIEQPVKMYSSGMYVRLAFAINIMSQPDIMIVDEALSVGDMKFQAKCMTALTRRQEAGTTVLFVSHDIGTIKSLCSRGIYLEHGELKNMGTAADVAESYIRIMREEMNSEQRDLNPIPTLLPAEKESSIDMGSVQNFISKGPEEFNRRVSQFRYGTGEARITYVELLNMDDGPISMVGFNQSVKIRIYFEAHAQKLLTVNFNVMDDKKNNITGSNFLLAGQSLLEVRPGDRYQVDYALRFPLAEGGYSIQAALTEPVIPDQTANFFDVVSDAVVFSVSRWETARVWSKVYLFPAVEVTTLSQR